MKVKNLRAERKIFPSFEIKLSVKTAVKFVIESLLIFLFASAGKFGFALALALFCGLTYARQNILILAPSFIVATCVFSLSWWTLLYAATPVIILISLYLVFLKLRKNVPMYAVAIAALISMVPYIVCNCVFHADYFTVSIAALIGVIMTFICAVTAYAVFVRGYVHAATIDELICSGVVAAVIGYALGGVNIYSFNCYYIVFTFAVLFSSVCFKMPVTFFLTILLGIGASLRAGSLLILAACTLVGTIAIVFSPFTKWASGVAMIAATAVCYLVGTYGNAGWQTLIMSSIGVILCVVIPTGVFMKVKSLTKSDNRRAFTGIVNLRGKELSAKLYSTSDVFYNLSKSLNNLAVANEKYTPERLAREVAKNYCGKCEDRDKCFKALGADTSSVILPLASAAMTRGTATFMDMPTFLTSRCSKMHSLEGVVNNLAEAYSSKRGEHKGNEASKKMMSEQFAGISKVLDSLAAECAEQVNFAGDDVEFIKSDLLKHNVVASEVVLYGKGREKYATLLVRATDCNKTIIPKRIGAIWKSKCEVVRTEDRGEQKLIYLRTAPAFEVAYGVAETTRDGEKVSGDSKSILCPSFTRRLFAICDGMGSGDKANGISREAVGMIESFYRAGFDNEIILNLVNKLLKISVDDAYTTLDIAVIDTATGGLDLIKLGAANSYIIRRDNVEILNSCDLPVGIVDNVNPYTNRYQLYDGDMLVMMTDGVQDVLTDRGIVDTVDELNTLNPQTLADALMKKAVLVGAKDDCTVLVMRIFAT